MPLIILLYFLVRLEWCPGCRLKPGHHSSHAMTCSPDTNPT